MTSTTHTANSCSSLDPVTNGLIMYSPGLTEPFDIGTTATYSCNSGFTLGGVVNRTCTAGGVWSGGASVCTGSLIMILHVYWNVPPTPLAINDNCTVNQSIVVTP